MEAKEVYRSGDGARHWRRMAATVTDHEIGKIPASGGLDGLVAVTGTRAYLGLSRFTQIQTTDGGRSWRESFPDPADDGAHPLNFVDSNALKTARLRHVCSPESTESDGFANVMDGRVDDERGSRSVDRRAFCGRCRR
jgi:hypothetical protein